jgi:hypothetical protein
MVIAGEGPIALPQLIIDGGPVAADGENGARPEPDERPFMLPIVSRAR